MVFEKWFANDFFRKSKISDFWKYFVTGSHGWKFAAKNWSSDNLYIFWKKVHVTGSHGCQFATKNWRSDNLSICVSIISIWYSFHGSFDLYLFDIALKKAKGFKKYMICEWFFKIIENLGTCKNIFCQKGSNHHYIGKVMTFFMRKQSSFKCAIYQTFLSCNSWITFWYSTDFCFAFLLFAFRFSANKIKINKQFSNQIRIKSTYPHCTGLVFLSFAFSSSMRTGRPRGVTTISQH